MRSVAIGPGCQVVEDDQTILAVNDEVYLRIDRRGENALVWVRVPAKGGLVLAQGNAVTTEEVWDMFEDFAKAARAQEKAFKQYSW